MSEPGARVAWWFTVFADLGRLPLTEIPIRHLVDCLGHDFSVTAASWNSRENGRSGLVIEPFDAIDAVTSQFAGWEDGQHDSSHALLTWYAKTRDPRPWTSGRVPTRILSKRQRAFVDDLMRPIEMDQQLSISYRTDGRDFRAFVLGRGGRGGRDFTDDDVVVAGYIQRGLLALDAQSSLLARLQAADPGRVAAAEALTGRELAVLQLLVDGCPTRVIGRRLACSPRTVEKHLEHVYRKLGVKDRVNAVRMALAWGLREAPDPVRPPTRVPVPRGA